MTFICIEQVTLEDEMWLDLLLEWEGAGVWGGGPCTSSKFTESIEVKAFKQI